MISVIVIIFGMVVEYYSAAVESSSGAFFIDRDSQQNRAVVSTNSDREAKYPLSALTVEASQSNRWSKTEHRAEESETLGEYSSSCQDSLAIATKQSSDTAAHDQPQTALRSSTSSRKRPAASPPPGSIDRLHDLRLKKLPAVAADVAPQLPAGAERLRCISSKLLFGQK